MHPDVPKAFRDFPLTPYTGKNQLNTVLQTSLTLDKHGSEQNTITEMLDKTGEITEEDMDALLALSESFAPKQLQLLPGYAF